jgi:putative ABC transport system substrate-binding protein
MAARGVPVRKSADIENVIAALAGNPAGGLIVIPDIFMLTASQRELIILLSARYRIPAIYPYRFMAVEGGLISYGVDAVDLHRRAADYVDRILRGAKPGDLPVQAPTKFELVINLKTAKVLGLMVPPTLLARADEVIE